MLVCFKIKENTSHYKNGKMLSLSILELQIQVQNRKRKMFKYSASLNLGHPSGLPVKSRRFLISDCIST
jgi:hypothetical protein